ncbi:MAG: hypothetical protein KGJ93_03305, partial [Patescibacteria group bacterium]|nr:hypothetical protein [Patescibacteria group bacterium]
MRKFIKKHANKIIITALIVAAAACGVFFDWRHKNRETQTVFQTLGDESYPQTIKSEDIAPLPV